MNKTLNNWWVWAAIGALVLFALAAYLKKKAAGTTTPTASTIVPATSTSVATTPTNTNIVRPPGVPADVMPNPDGSWPLIKVF